MPSPVGHALGGAIAAALAAPRGSALAGGAGVAAARAWVSHPLVRVGAVAGCLPDIDFLWGRHNMETHSVGAAVAAALVATVLLRSRRAGLTTALAWLTHVLFDWLGSDDTPPLGVMAFWPLDDRFFFAHAYVFEAISRRYWLPNFVAHNAWAVTSEVLILAPILVVLLLMRSRRAIG
jgi:membrane-bound metal-dependent hydrolase YbcI (DUF457 family)